MYDFDTVFIAVSCIVGKGISNIYLLEFDIAISYERTLKRNVGETFFTHLWEPFSIDSKRWEVRIQDLDYSVRKLFAGFAIPVFIV